MYSWRKRKDPVLRTNPIGRDTLEELEMTIKDLEDRGFSIVRQWEKDELWKDFSHTKVQQGERFRKLKYEETLHRTRYYVIMEKENEEVLQ